MITSFRNFPVLLLAFSTVAPAQVPAPVRAALNFNTIVRPPIPADPLELATSAAQPVLDAQQR